MIRLAILPVLLAAGPAFAHQGDHSAFDAARLVLHLLEPDHVLFAAIAVLTGILAYRAGRRAEARAMLKRKPEDRA